MSAYGGREPSVSSLAEALARTDPAAPKPRIALAQPTPLVRVLIGAVLTLALVFLAALLALGVRVAGLVDAMREDRAASVSRERDMLPATEVLLDVAAARREAAARPLAASRIWHQRCRLLAEAQDWQGVAETAAWVSETSPGDLLPATRLLHAEALHHLGRHAEAGRELHRLDHASLDAAERERAADLGGRLWLAGP